MGKARRALLAFTVVVAYVVLAPACTSFEPEVGDLLPACIDADSNPAVTVSFKDQIRPIMSGAVPGPRPCADCHYTSRGTQAGIDAVQLNLETLGNLRKGGQNTATNIVVAGHPCQSAIVQKLRGTFEGTRMPKGGPFWNTAQIQLMMDWIAEGAEGADDE